MKAHHIAALIGSVGLSGIALTDAFVLATTGHDSIFADDAGPVGAVLANDVWHGLTYAALTWVLVAEAARLAGANRVARGLPVGADCLPGRVRGQLRGRRAGPATDGIGGRGVRHGVRGIGHADLRRHHPGRGRAPGSR